MDSGDDKDKDALQRWADTLPSYESRYQQDQGDGGADSDAPDDADVPDLESLEKFDWRGEEEAESGPNYYGLAILGRGLDNGQVSDTGQ